jgi:outer membrane receptor protein involved in Fe transport
VALAVCIAAIATFEAWAATDPENSLIHFDIPRQRADLSLIEFAEQAKITLLFPYETVKKKTANRLKGHLPIAAAAKTMLAGTGLQPVFDEHGVLTTVSEAEPVPGVEHMNTTSRKGRWAAVLASIFIGSGLEAQSGDGLSESGDESTATLEEIIVTGTRLPSSAIEAPAPVTVYDADYLRDTNGTVSIGDAISDLPQFRASNNQAASAGFSASSTAGLNLLDLRGMGPSRTLVLVNGRRHVSSSQSTVQPDINTIPRALFSRVEVLTGGASAVYGADAIAGVVNFVLKDDFEGFEAHVRGGISSEGDASSVMADLTAGRDFADGRGNIVVSAEFATNDSLRYRDRAFSAVQSSFAPDLVNNTGPNDGIPDQLLVRDLRLLFLSTGGTLINSYTGGVPEVWRFAPDGSLNPANTGSRSFFPPIPITSGGDGLNSIEDQTLLPSQDRVSLNLLGHFDINDDTSLFFEGKAVNVETASFAQPSSSSLTFSVDNPFLNPAARETLLGLLPPEIVSFSINRVNRDLGVPEVQNERFTTRFVAGVEGTFSSRWNYELSYTYGRTETDSRFLNNSILPRISLSADAVVDVEGLIGSPGAIVCRAKLNAGGSSTGNPDIDNCVATSFFGEGAVSQAARDYINIQTVAEGTLEQHVFGGYTSLDTEGLFELPGGPLGLVFGFEYRSEDTDFLPDERDLAGNTTRAGIQAISGGVDVSEGYAEVVAPLLADMPGAHLLELRGAVRMANYDLPGVGTNTSWGLGLNYAPIPDFRLRGSLQEAVRSPNISELYAPVVPTNFSVLDPCDSANLDSGSPTRRANCAALGIPPDFIASTVGGSVPGVSGGNPQLDVESGRTWTLGAVVTPESLPNLMLSVDYFDIELEDAISLPTANALVTLCVDSSSIDNVFCDLVTRNPTTHDISFISQLGSNIARQTVRGVDLDASYQINWGQHGQMLLRLVASRLFERDDFPDPTNPGFTVQQLKRVGVPEDQVTFSASYERDWLNLTYSLRYFSGQLRTDPANVESVGGQPPRNPEILPPDLLNTGGEYYHSISGRFDLGEQLSIYAGIENIFEPTPPPGIYGAGFGGANYDSVGRYYFAGVRWSY